jgi:hypothetical protein
VRLDGRTAIEQERDHVPIAIMRRRQQRRRSLGPIVDGAAGVEQTGDHRTITVQRRAREWRPQEGLGTDVGIGAVLQQQANALGGAGVVRRQQ